MGLGFTIMEDAVMENGRYMNENFDTYLIPTILDIPIETTVTAIEELVPGDDYSQEGLAKLAQLLLLQLSFPPFMTLQEYGLINSQ